MVRKRGDVGIPLPLEPHESWLALDDRSIAIHFWAWFMNLVLGRWGVDLKEEFKSRTWESVLEEHDELFCALPRAAFDLDQDDPEGVLLQKAAKFCAEGELLRAGALVRGIIEERARLSKAETKVDATNAEQRARASKRRPTPFSDLVDHIVKRNPDISESDFLSRLMSERGNGVVESVENDEYIWLTDECVQKTRKISGLKDILYKAKKK